MPLLRNIQEKKNQENHIAEVKRVFVKEQYRGFGIAKELMNNLETQAVKQGYKKTYFRVR